jgi:hypothetical protein
MGVLGNFLTTRRSGMDRQANIEEKIWNLKRIEADRAQQLQDRKEADAQNGASFMLQQAKDPQWWIGKTDAEIAAANQAYSNYLVAFGQQPGELIDPRYEIRRNYIAFEAPGIIAKQYDPQIAHDIIAGTLETLLGKDFEYKRALEEGYQYEQAQQAGLIPPAGSTGLLAPPSANSKESVAAPPPPTTPIVDGYNIPWPTDLSQQYKQWTEGDVPGTFIPAEPAAAETAKPALTPTAPALPTEPVAPQFKVTGRYSGLIRKHWNPDSQAAYTGALWQQIKSSGTFASIIGRTGFTDLFLQNARRFQVDITPEILAKDWGAAAGKLDEGQKLDDVKWQEQLRKQQKDKENRLMGVLKAIPITNIAAKEKAAQALIDENIFYPRDKAALMAGEYDGDFRDEKIKSTEQIAADKLGWDKDKFAQTQNFHERQFAQLKAEQDKKWTTLTAQQIASNAFRKESLGYTKQRLDIAKTRKSGGLTPSKVYDSFTQLNANIRYFEMMADPKKLKKDDGTDFQYGEKAYFEGNLAAAKAARLKLASEYDENTYEPIAAPTPTTAGGGSGVGTPNYEKVSQQQFSAAKRQGIKPGKLGPHVRKKLMAAPYNLTLQQADAEFTRLMKAYYR